MTHATLEWSVPALNDVFALARSFNLSLRARNRSPETIKSYVGTVDLFGEFLLASGFPTSIDCIGREHVESFIADQLTSGSPRRLVFATGTSSSSSNGASKKAKSRKHR